MPPGVSDRTYSPIQDLPYALVGAAAKQHGVVLATRDRRALETYRILDVRVEYVS
jgi:predicted nucleic acid-binding protein